MPNPEPPTPAQLLPDYLAPGFFLVKDPAAWETHVADNGADNPVIEVAATAGHRMQKLLGQGLGMSDAIGQGLKEAFADICPTMSEMGYNHVLQVIATHWWNGEQFGEMIRQAYEKKRLAEVLPG